MFYPGIQTNTKSIPKSNMKISILSISMLLKINKANYFLGVRIILNMGTKHGVSKSGHRRSYIKATLGQQWSITKGLNVSELTSDIGWNHYFNGQLKVNIASAVLMEKIQKRVSGHNIHCGLFTPKGFSTFSYFFEYIIFTSSKRLLHRYHLSCVSSSKDKMAVEIKNKTYINQNFQCIILISKRIKCINLFEL